MAKADWQASVNKAAAAVRDTKSGPILIAAASFEQFPRSAGGRPPDGSKTLADFAGAVGIELATLKSYRRVTTWALRNGVPLDTVLGWDLSWSCLRAAAGQFNSGKEFIDWLARQGLPAGVCWTVAELEAKWGEPPKDGELVPELRESVLNLQLPQLRDLLSDADVRAKITALRAADRHDVDAGRLPSDVAAMSRVRRDLQRLLDFSDKWETAQDIPVHLDFSADRLRDLAKMGQRLDDRAALLRREFTDIEADDGDALLDAGLSQTEPLAGNGAKAAS